MNGLSIKMTYTCIFSCRYNRRGMEGEGREREREREREGGGRESVRECE